jgi:DNA invertase Pin-like site-specific DNA recombinase
MESAMAAGRFVSYLRVSTAKQGHSGLGLEAQRIAVADYLNGGNWHLVTERVCRLHNATLVIAKLDRLSRDAHFLLGLEKAGVDFVAADMPSANRLTVGIMAMVADEERGMISKRTKDALAASKARGKKLGGNRGNLAAVADKGRAISLATRQAKAQSRAADLAPIIAELKASGADSFRRIAAELNARGIRAARGGAWSQEQVRRVIEQMEIDPHRPAVRPPA